MDGGIRPERPVGLGADEPMGDWNGGVIFEGTKGKMMADCYGANPRLIPTVKMNDLNVPETLPRVPEGHYVQWVNACMKGYGKGVTSSPFDYAGPFTEALLLGVLAIKGQYIKEGNEFPARRQLLWDAKNMKITNVPAVNEFVRREGRKGWVV
jgi:hypothetical protein